MDKRVDNKIIIILFIGIFLVVSLIRFNNSRKVYFANSNLIQLKMDQIGHKELNLNYTVLESTIYLFNNNDKIEQAIKSLQKTIKDLKNDKNFRENFPKIYKKFVNSYIKEMDKKIELIYEFGTINSAIKNSNTYLINALSRLPYFHERYISNMPHGYIRELMKSISNILLSKNSLRNFIDVNDIKNLENIKFKTKKLQEFNNITVAHLKMIYKNFPIYKNYLKKITDTKCMDILSSINNEFFTKNLKRVKEINYVFYAIILLVILYTLFVIVLLTRINKENYKLNIASKKLRETIRTDMLTKLGNRQRYEEEIKGLDNIVLFIVNIDKFKHINEYFGTDTGDSVLKTVASILKNITKNYDPKIYRLGADDFGVLVDKENIESFEKVSEEIISWFENNKISIGKFSFRISVSIGISDKRPFFEKADIALSEVKESIRLKYLLFTESCKRVKNIENNIKKTSTLYQAIKDDRIVPVYQPIVDIETKKIVKYEVLARLVHEDGRVESIFPYLKIAMDNKLYFDITKAILIKSVSYLYDKNIDFNLNFSIEDINDNKIMNILKKLEESYRDIFKRVTFELLESEAIEDYEAINSFIKYVKSKGAKIAIDDFGSGYSNFEHIIKLDIDYLKIDGSLIKNIDSNSGSLKIVSLMSRFAKDTNIQTVAEFVENEAIWQKLKELGINLGQGYYFSKPLESI